MCLSHAWRRWSGYIVASSYELSHEREYHAIRSSAALLDISPLYKYRVQGPDAARLLDRVVTRNVARSRQGQVLYTGWCDAAGKMLDDGTIARLDEDFFRMTSAEPGLRWLEDNAVGLDVALEDISDSIAALALQGPSSRAILQEVADTDLAQLKYFRIVATTLRGIRVTISRTGYTGERGYELLVPRDAAGAVWDALLSAGEEHGIVPCGLGARDTLRTEMGYPLHGQDISLDVTPVQARLGWAVGWKKDAFWGRDVLLAEKEAGPKRLLRGLVATGRGIPRPGMRVMLTADVMVGEVTSGTFSPTLRKGIEGEDQEGKPEQDHPRHARPEVRNGLKIRGHSDGEKSS